MAAVWLLAGAASLSALPVPEAVARLVAQNTIRQHIALFGAWGGVQAARVEGVDPIAVGTDRLLYNVRVSPRGHVLVAADDEFSPVLLYSDTHSFDVSRTADPDAFESWLVRETGNVRRRLQDRARGRAPGSRPDRWDESRPGLAWGRFGVPEARFAPLGRRSTGTSSIQTAGVSLPADVSVQAVGIVGPLLSTDWAQGDPYNSYTPADAGCSHTKAGCVAIAMAQLMRYWSWPASGTGSHSYIWNGLTLRADFNHSYDWANMSGRLDGSSTAAEIDAVARLIADAGISVNMWYGCGSSSASTSYAATSALPTYFSYKPTSGQVSRAGTTAPEFFSRIQQELDAAPARPMLFTVYTTGGGGHSLVIDGYQMGLTDKVHLNLGWGASYQGWYDITNNWSAGGYLWDASSQAIYPGIEPADNPSPVPATTSLQPSSVPGGSGAFTLTVNGSNFVASSVVRWNGSARTTTYVSATQLQAVILASDVGVVGTATVTVATPAPGGGTSNGQAFTITTAINPAPKVSTISPASAIAGAAAFTLTVNGSSFVASSVVRWNGSARTTTYVSSTRLRASITAGDVAAGGTFPVSVYTPAPGGGTSGAATFTVTTPAPSLTSLSPESAVAGAGAFTMTLTGTGFVPSSLAYWNGVARTTTYRSATQLQVAIPASDVAAAGLATVTVATPAPGGGTSSARTFTVEHPPADPAVIDMRAAAAPSGTWVFAEGAVGLAGGFSTYYLVANENDGPARVRAWVIGQDAATPTSFETTVPATSRTTIDLSALVSGAPGAYSIAFQSVPDAALQIPAGRQIYVARSAYWGATEGIQTGPGHLKTGTLVAPGASLPAVWYFSEGARVMSPLGQFQTYYTVFNPTQAAANILVEFLGDSGEGVIRAVAHTVAAQSRWTLSASDYAELDWRNFSVRLTSTNGVGIVAERPMYWGRSWAGGHAGAGGTTMSRDWYFAEGTSQTGFDTYYTLLNPAVSPVAVEATYQLSPVGGVPQAPIVRTYTLPPASRTTIYLNGEVGYQPGVAAEFHASDAIVAERSMYWSVPWTDGSTVAGVPTPAVEWHLPEGSTINGYETYLCLSNPNTAAASVDVTTFSSAGAVETKTVTVGAKSRLTVWMNNTTPANGPVFSSIQGATFSIRVVSSGAAPLPIVAEQAVYWNRLSGAAQYWRGGDAALGWPVIR